MDRYDPPGVTWQLNGWGLGSLRHPRRRGGFWSLHTFTTLKEAKAEQKKQLRDQAWRVKQKALDLKKNKDPRGAQHRWGEDFGHKFPIFKVTRELVP